MTGISRDNDTAGGDLIPSQSTVFANNNLVIINGDAIAYHGRSPHNAATIPASSSNVFAGGKPVVQKGDVATCGDTATGSGNVNVNIAESVSFANDLPVIAVSVEQLNSAAIIEEAALVSVAMPAGPVAQGAIEPSYQGTPASEVTTSTGVVSEAVSTDFVAWMAARIAEGKDGLWTRQSPPKGQGPAVSPGNPNITNIWKSIGLNYYASNDQTAWCMGFVNFALKQNGYAWCSEASAYAIRDKPQKWNAVSVPLDQGQPGDIALWNFGHVNLVYTAVGGKYTFCGGNQNGKSTNNNPQNSCVSQSWPGGYKPPGDGSLVGLWRPSKIAPTP